MNVIGFDNIISVFSVSYAWLLDCFRYLLASCVAVAIAWDFWASQDYNFIKVWCLSFVCRVSLLLRRTQAWRALVFDAARACMIILSCICLTQLHISWLYHFIRGETAIKLYAIYNILEVVDKLFCSIGHDITDALYRSLNTRQDKRVVALHFFLALGYSDILFCHE